MKEECSHRPKKIESLKKSKKLEEKNRNLISRKRKDRKKVNKKLD
jgi:hypothetical protein